MKRRDFINRTALASSALVFPTYGIAENLYSTKNTTNSIPEIFVFSKHLQFLNYNDMCEATKEMGFNGLDLTVRPKGHVFPEHVIDDLPKATEAMKLYGLTPKMFSSNVIDVTNEIERTVLKTAKGLGYEFYRPAWIKYKSDDDILKKVELAKKSFTELAQFNKEIGIKASYHNHSGHYVGASIWDLHKAIEHLSPTLFGSQYDIMHATLEGGHTWEIGFNLIKSHINTLVVKDFIWQKTNGNWDKTYVPLGKGMVDFKRYFKLLKQNNINVPISLHVEYDLGGAEHGAKPSIEHKEVFKRIKHDLDFIKRMWNS